MICRDSVKTIGMDWQRMLFCVLHHPMYAEPHNIPTEITIKEAFKWGRVVGRRRPAQHQEHCSDILRVTLDVVSGLIILNDFCCVADGM
jgi:hypothetical protein